MPEEVLCSTPEEMQLALSDEKTRGDNSSNDAVYTYNGVTTPTQPPSPPQPRYYSSGGCGNNAYVCATKEISLFIDDPLPVASSGSVVDEKTHSRHLLDMISTFDSDTKSCEQGQGLPFKGYSHNTRVTGRSNDVRKPEIDPTRNSDHIPSASDVSSISLNQSCYSRTAAQPIDERLSAEEVIRKNTVLQQIEIRSRDDPAQAYTEDDDDVTRVKASFNKSLL